MKNEFNGGYIEARQEAYNLLLAKGYRPKDSSKGWNADSPIRVFVLHDEEFSGLVYSDTLITNGIKEFYITNGEFLWEKPSQLQQICDNPDVISASQLDATTSLDDLPLSPIAEMKEKFATDKYDIYFIKNGKWCFSTGDSWEDITREGYKLILKEHFFIGIAAVHHPDILRWREGRKLSWTTGNGYLFFENYNEGFGYGIEFTYNELQDIEDIGGAKEDKDMLKHLDLEKANDGGKNDFYTFPLYVKNVDSLSRYLELSGAEFNILKSLTSNLGERHASTDAKREAKKCLHYAVERMLYTFTSEEILSQIQKQLKGN